MSTPLNRTEEYVTDICTRSFLTFWCYPNAQAPNGKELCDLLIVCHPHVIIVSVKEIKLNEKKDPSVAFARWERKAVDESVSQIFGAERALQGMSHALRRDGSQGLELPALAERKVHRIAVAFGDNNQATIKSGGQENGYVHVMGAQSFSDVLAELDTITDFTDYLAAKETLRRVVCEGSEANMLAWYLIHDRTFPPPDTFIVFDDTLWAGLKNDKAFIRRQVANEDSYGWDRLIEGLSDPRAVPIEGPGPTLTEMDMVLRTMARESRFHRRDLAIHASAFFQAAKEGRGRARIQVSLSGVIYLFSYFGNAWSPPERSAAMVGRSYLARKYAGKGDVVVGIGLSPFQPGIGSQSDLIYVKFPRWSEVEINDANRYQEMTGDFAGGVPVHHSSMEYPPEPPAK